MIIAPDPWNIFVKLTVNRLRVMGAIVLSFFYTNQMLLQLLNERFGTV
jgi:hypothetical protein